MNIINNIIMTLLDILLKNHGEGVCCKVCALSSHWVHHLSRCMLNVAIIV